MPIPLNITSEHIREAIRFIDRMDRATLRASTKFDLIVRGRRYPPKEVLRIANELVNQQELVNFGGGDESNNYLIRRGFRIVLKDTFEEIGLNYTKSKRSELGLTDSAGTDPGTKMHELAGRMASIESDELTDTEKEQVVRARIGQSLFKTKLFQRNPKCWLCGVSNSRLLIASHVKPWSQSADLERLDQANGLLLCPNHDALFDKGFISFDRDGRILISDALDAESAVSLNVDPEMTIELDEDQQYYMSWHREYRFR